MSHPIRLLNKNFVLLWQGQFASNLGSQLSIIALSFWIKHTTESAALMGTMMMLASLPGVILGPIAGTLADRFSRRRIIILTDFMNGLAMLSLSGVMLLFPDRTELLLLSITFVFVVNGGLNAFFSPAISAAIPELVPPSGVSKANSLSSLGLEASMFLGQGLGGLLFRLLGAPLVFLIDGITFLLASLSQVFICIPQDLPEKSSDWRQNARQFKNDAMEGLRYILKKDGLRELVFVSAILTFFSTPVIFLLPFFIEDILKLQPDWYGYLVATYGAGTMLGYLVSGFVRLNGKSRYLWMVVFITAESCGFALLGLMRNPILVLLVAFLGGVARGFVTVNMTTILQVTTPSDIRGRVFGFLAAITGALAPVAMGLSGIVADLVNWNIPMIYVVSGTILAVLSLALLSLPNVRRFLAQDEGAAQAVCEEAGHTPRASVVS